jgi:hypothetical protein
MKINTLVTKDTDKIEQPIDKKIEKKIEKAKKMYQDIR